ncbi:MAG: hypothetical protein ETSY1_28410 [Candidatus Entotheonella factor]|uniref:Uncharacterized protein n=1 Tax=Entotheonella factor TaxID=1429438 RepID=W4LDG9_ENTF1|nr:hypothetical protein [Candidatus Entotheonella palauensis]ETW95984.1 MAG: hypothetical protein ETSY1_28410 [Candidatus Entotheonella factor]
MAMIKTVGRSGQIALGKEYAGRHVLIDQPEPGVWIIKLGTFVPDNEQWLLEPNTQQELDEAITWAEQNPPQPSNLNDLAAQIEA